ARAHLDELVEQTHRPDDEPSELRTAENGARPCVDAKRPGCVRPSTRANVFCERVPGCDRSAKEPPFAGQFVELQISEAEQPYLVGLDAAVEAPGEPGEATPVRSLARAGRGEGDPWPRPARRRSSVSELVIEHLPHHGDRPPVSRIRIPGDQRVDERRVEKRRIVLPVDASEGLSVEHRVVEVHLRPCPRIAWDATLDEVPAKAKNAVVAEAGVRAVPGQELPV